MNIIQALEHLTSRPAGEWQSYSIREDGYSVILQTGQMCYFTKRQVNETIFPALVLDAANQATNTKVTPTRKKSPKSP